MQVIMTRAKKFNIHNLKDLNKIIKDSFKYAKTYWDITVPICNQDKKDSYFRIAYNLNKKLSVYITMDAWVWSTQEMTEWELSQILYDNVLKYDN